MLDISTRNPKLWSGAKNFNLSKPYDPARLASWNERYGDGMEGKSAAGASHPGVHDQLGMPSFDTINRLNAEGNLPEGVNAALRALGWEGEAITLQTYKDCIVFVNPATGLPFWVPVNAAWVAAITGGEPAPNPTPTPAPVQGSELYESGHEISAKLPKGTKIKRAVGAFETTWGGVNALALLDGTNQADRDGVNSDELRGYAKAAKGSLLAFYAILSQAYADGLDAIPESEREEAQLAADVVWKLVVKSGELALAQKVDGYELVEGDNRRPIFEHSRYTRIRAATASNLTVAVGLYGLRGELLPDGTRDATYFDPFMSWASQDPALRRKGGTGPGLHVPGSSSGNDSLADAIAARG